MVENPGREVKELTWNNFDIMTDTLATILKSEFPRLRFVYGIPRGGLVLAVKLSHMLNLKMIYIEDDMDMWPKEELLIVDDISDSGTTLDELMNAEREGILTACLFKREGSIFEPDIVMENIKEEWIEFPWEVKK